MLLFAGGTVAGAAPLGQSPRARARQGVCGELIDAHAARIEARNPDVNAIVLPRLEQAREEARAADTAVAYGEPLGPLHGVPYTAKEVIPVAGMPATNGSRLLADRVSSADAEVIRRMRHSARSSSARRTSRSSARSGTRSTSSMGRRGTRTTARAPRAGRRAARRRRSPRR